MMDGKTRLKHVERLTEINKLRNFASCWLYSEKRPKRVYTFADSPQHSPRMLKDEGSFLQQTNSEY